MLLAKPLCVEVRSAIEPLFLKYLKVMFVALLIQAAYTTVV